MQTNESNRDKVPDRHRGNETTTIRGEDALPDVVIRDSGEGLTDSTLGRVVRALRRAVENNRAYVAARNLNCPELTNTQIGKCLREVHDRDDVGPDLKIWADAASSQTVYRIVGTDGQVGWADAE